MWPNHAKFYSRELARKKDKMCKNSTRLVRVLPCSKQCFLPLHRWLISRASPFFLDWPRQYNPFQPPEVPRPKGHIPRLLDFILNWTPQSKECRGVPLPHLCSGLWSRFFTPVCRNGQEKWAGVLSEHDSPPWFWPPNDMSPVRGCDMKASGEPPEASELSTHGSHSHPTDWEWNYAL